jgi:hypothetical protein
MVVTARIAEYRAQVAAAAVGHPVQVGEETAPAPRYFLATNDVRLEYYRLYVEPEMPERSEAELAATVAKRYSSTMNVVIVRE